MIAYDWKWNLGARIWHEKNSSKLFDGKLSRPHSYFVALAMASWIFAKPGKLKGICHHLSDGCYRMLIRLEDLTRLAQMKRPAVLKLTDADCKAMLRGPDGPLAIDNALQDDPGSGDEGTDCPGLGEDGGVLLLLDDGVQVEAPPQVVDHQIPEKKFTMQGMPTVHVRYDNFSHESGHRRAFVTCPLHDKCKKWCFLKSHGNCPERAAAYLLAWVRDGQQWVQRNSTPIHIPSNPTNALVDLVEGQMNEA
jgi:hypothetical protein